MIPEEPIKTLINIVEYVSEIPGGAAVLEVPCPSRCGRVWSFSAIEEEREKVNGVIRQCPNCKMIIREELDKVVVLKEGIKNES